MLHSDFFIREHNILPFTKENVFNECYKLENRRRTHIHTKELQPQMKRYCGNDINLENMHSGESTAIKHNYFLANRILQK